MQATAPRVPRLQVGALADLDRRVCRRLRGVPVDHARLALTKPKPVAIVTGYNLAMGTAFGTILIGCGLLACRRWRGDTSFPSLAGTGCCYSVWRPRPPTSRRSWPISIETCMTPAYPLTPYLAQFLVGGPGTWPAGYHQAVGWSVGAMAGLGFLVALRRLLPRHWLAVFLTFFVVSTILAVGHIPFLIRPLHRLASAT